MIKKDIQKKRFDKRDNDTTIHSYVEHNSKIYIVDY